VALLNLTTDALNSTFAYDAENWQTSYNSNGIPSLNATYEYDGDGKRVKQIQNGITTFFVYDVQGRLAAEYSTQPSLQAPSPRYLTIDHLGSTRIVTGPAGTVLTRHDYLPFGDEVASNYAGRSTFPAYGSSANPVRQKFTGKERDAESALDFFLARYYSGAQGRFTSSDPKQFPYDVSDPQSWNKYAYSRNNPLRYVDPDGEDFWDFLNGMANATSTNAVAGLGRQTGNSDFALGQRLGDAISVVGGVIEIVGGGTAAGGGVAACGTGVLCVAGAPAAVGGTAVAGHGAARVGMALAHLMGGSESASQGSQAVDQTSAGGSKADEAPGGRMSGKLLKFEF
jgi:RHS repeat-associated protein